MNKLLKYCILVTSLSLSSCSLTNNEGEPKDNQPVINPIKDDDGNEKTLKEKYKLMRDTSLVADTHYKNGFYLISPESTNQYKEKDLDYNGTAESDTYDYGDRVNYWQMCQWWTPYNFKDASYRKEGDVHIYENTSRYFGINTVTSELTMKLDADKEYKERYKDFDGVRQGNDPWSHFLIQQSFPSKIAVYPGQINSDYGLHVTFDITIDEATYKGSGTPTGADCAQLMFYLLIRNNVPADSDPAEVGKRNAKLWFGMPIFDTRYATVDKYIGGDTGFQGATGHLIYSISSKNFMGNNAIVFGQKYHVDMDVTEFMQQAFIYGAQNGYLTNCNWKNMLLDYMNFGWEIPGNYSVASRIQNLDVYVG